LNQIFNTLPLVWDEWRYLLPLLILPAVAAEATKWAISRRQ